MESISWIGMLNSANSNSLSTTTTATPEMIIEDNNFANEIFLKFVDETSHIDLLETNGKTNDKNEYDDVTPMTIADDFIANIDSLLDQVLTSPLTSPEIYCLSSSPQPTLIYHQQNIASEYNNVYDIVQNTQSSFANNTIINSSHENAFFDTEKIISSVSVDIKRELEVVDELVRAHSRHASDCEDNYKLSFKSEYASSISSNCSLFGDDESSNISKKKREYRRNPDERRTRKKEQNKTAAIRYRKKKKQEIEVYMDEVKILVKKNRKLLKEYKETRRELKVLKNLMRELFQHRGLI